MKPENPFRTAFEQTGYHSGQWIVVSQSTVGGLLAQPMLVRGKSQTLRI
jgi:hypothetical protein